MPEIGIKNATINVSLGKRKARSQRCHIFTDDGRKVIVDEEVDHSCMPDFLRYKAFMIDETNQFLGKDGVWVQLVAEKACVPLCSEARAEERTKATGIPINNLIDQIFRDVHEEEKMKQYVIATKNFMLEKITQIIAIPAAALVIIYAINRYGG